MGIRTLEMIMASLDPEDAKTLASAADKRVTDAIKTYSSKNPTLPKLGARLEKIQVAADTRVRQLELQNYALRKCFEMKIDFATVEKLGLSFANEDQVDEKLATLSESIQTKKIQDMNEFMVNNSFRPGSGGRPNPGATIGNLTADEAVGLELAGSLDRLLRQGGK
jgi:hypothetical protein